MKDKNVAFSRPASSKLRKRDKENKRHRPPFLRFTRSYFCTPFTASSLLSESLEQAIKTLHVFFSLKTDSSSGNQRQPRGYKY